MGNGIIALGLFAYFLTLFLSFFLYSQSGQTQPRRLKLSMAIWPILGTGPVFAANFLRLFGLYLLVIGVIFSFLSDEIVSGISKQIILIIILVIPIWTIAVINEKRRKSSK